MSIEPPTSSRARIGDRLAVVERLELGELVGVRFQEIAELPDQLARARPASMRRPRAAFERPPRRRDRAVDVGRVALRDVGDRLLGRRILDREGLAGHGVDPCAVDQQLLGLGEKGSGTGRPATASARQRSWKSPCHGGLRQRAALYMNRYSVVAMAMEPPICGRAIAATTDQPSVLCSGKLWQCQRIDNNNHSNNCQFMALLILISGSLIDPTLTG